MRMSPICSKSFTESSMKRFVPLPRGRTRRNHVYFDSSTIDFEKLRAPITTGTRTE